MSLRLLPDGAPGQDLGIAHTLKHFLCPTEMWQDVTGGLADRLRPRAVVQDLPQKAPWRHAQDPPAALAAQWERLRTVYRQGYGHLVRQAVAELGLPDTHPQTWVALDGKWRALDQQRALHVWVRRKRNGWQLYTAFRPSVCPHRDHDCPPRDATSVSLRQKISLLKARQQHARWIHQAHQEN